MKKKYKLSIITVVLNDFNNIERTILNVINQIATDIEYIVIDGGSDDGTYEIINNYSNQISTIISETDNGIYHAVNKGILLARGEYIGILNSGDIYCEGLLSRILNEIFFLPDIIYGDIYFSDETNKSLRLASLSNIDNKMSIFHPSTFISKKVYEKLGTYNTKYVIAADYDFILNSYLNKFTFHYLNFPFVIFNLDGISTKNYKLGMYENFIIKNQYFNYFSNLTYYLFKLSKFYFMRFINSNSILLFFKKCLRRLSSL